MKIIDGPFGLRFIQIDAAEIYLGKIKALGYMQAKGQDTE